MEVQTAVIPEFKIYNRYQELERRAREEKELAWERELLLAMNASDPLGPPHSRWVSPRCRKTCPVTPSVGNGSQQQTSSVSLPQKLSVAGSGCPRASRPSPSWTRASRVLRITGVGCCTPRRRGARRGWPSCRGGCRASTT